MRSSRRLFMILLSLAVMLSPLFPFAGSESVRAADAGTIFSDNCDSLGAAGYGKFFYPSGTTEDEKINILTADSAEKYGKTVPDGKCYFYSENDTALGKGKVLWKSITPAFSQAYSLSFDAAFSELPTATSGYHVYNTRRGFVAQVAREANGVLTRVGFNNLTDTTIDVYITKRNNHPTPTVYSEDYNEVFRTTVPIANPTAEHHWKISNDGNGLVTVYLDGLKVAEQGDVTVKGWGADTNPGLFLGIRMQDNLASPADANRTSFTIDNISLVEDEYVVPLTDAEAVQLTKDRLDFAAIRGLSTGGKGYVTGSLDLITADEASGAAIAWISSVPAIISNTGVVSRPAEDTPVTLTATITKGIQQETKQIAVTVLKPWDGPPDLVPDDNTIYYSNMNELGDTKWIKQYTHSKQFGTILASEGAAAYTTAVEPGQVVAFTHGGGDRTRRYLHLEPDARAWEIGADLKFMELAEASSPNSSNNAMRGFQIQFAQGTNLFRLGFNNLNETNKTVDVYLLKSNPAPGNLNSAQYYKATLPLVHLQSYNNWKLRFDGYGKLTLLLNDQDAAVVEGVDATTTELVNGYKGLTLIASSEHASETDQNFNYVYIDNVIFSKRELVFSGTDQQAVDQAYEEINYMTLKGLNPGTDPGVMTDLQLPASYPPGVALSYSTDRPDVLDVQTGKLLKQPGSEEVPFKVTVTVSKGESQRSKEIALYVRSDGGAKSALIPSPTMIYSSDASIQDWPMGYSQDHNMFIGSSQFISKHRTYIPEGEFLVYSQPGFRDRTRIWTYYPLGTGMWKLDFDARFMQLPEPTDPMSNSNSGYTGFVAQARNVEGTLYRVSFNNLDEINGTVDLYIGQSPGTNPFSHNAVYAEFKGVPLPRLHDFHKWSLIYDGKGELLVQLDDDEIVARAQGITMQGDGADIHNAIYFLGETNASSNDKNIEVYLDNIRFAKPYAIGDIAVHGESDSHSFKTNVQILEDPVKHDMTYNLRAEIELKDIHTGATIATKSAGVDGQTAEIVFAEVAQTGAVKAVARLFSDEALIDTKETNLYVYDTVIKAASGASVAAESGKTYLFDEFNGLSGWDVRAYTNSTVTDGKLFSSTSASRSYEVPITLNGWFGVYLTTSASNQEILLSASGTEYQVKTNLTGGQSEGAGHTTELMDTFVFAKNFAGEKVTILVPADKITSTSAVKFVSLSDEQIAIYNLPDLLEKGQPAKNIMVDEDGFSMFYGGLLPDTEALNGFIDKIADVGGWGALAWTTGTSTGFNYDSEFMGPAYEGAYDYEGYMRPGDRLVLSSIRNIVDSNDGKATGQVLAEYGDERGDFDVFHTLRMSFFYERSSLFPNLNAKKYFDLYEKGYYTSDRIGLSYMYEEVRDLYLNVLEEMAEFNGIDGVILDWSRYAKIVMNEYTGDQVEFRTQFMRDLRARLPNHKIGVKIVQDQWDQWANSPNVTYSTDNIDLQTWIDEGLVDIIMPIDKNEENYFDVGRYKQMVLNSSNPDKDKILIYPGIFSIDYRGKYLKPIDYIVRVHEMYEQGADGALMPVLHFSDDPELTPAEYKIIGDKNALKKWYELSYVPSYNKMAVMLGEKQPAAGNGTDGQIRIPSSETSPALISASELKGLIAGVGKGAAVEIDKSRLEKGQAITVALPIAELSDSEVSALVLAVPGGKVTIRMDKLLNQGLTDAEIEVIVRPDTGVAQLRAGKRMLEFNDFEHPVRFAMDYAADPDRNTDYLVAYLEDESGQGRILPLSYYDSGAVRFSAQSSGRVAILYREPAFNDTAGLWMDQDVRYLAARGIINGTGNKQFSPSAKVTRADFVTMLVRLLGVHAEPATRFDDVGDDAYYAGEVAAAKALGIVSGIGGNRFDPGGVISRQDAAVMLYRALQAYERLPKSPGDRRPEFKDVQEVAAYARESIEKLGERGIVQGSEARLSPRAHTTRAEAAAMLKRIITYFF